MPYLNHDQKLSIQMISMLLVLGIVLLAIPMVCALFVLFSKLKQNRRAEIMKNATATRTTVTTGSNGRTIFETTTIKTSPPRSPVLPFTRQQASKAPRPMSVKNTWQRLSRPFSTVHVPQEDDEIELTQTRTQKQRPAPHSSRFRESISPTTPDEPISPVSPPYSHRKGSSSSWNTVNALDSPPISPVSMTEMPASSSFAGADPHGYQANKYSQPQQGREDYTNPYRINPPPIVRTDSKSSQKSKAEIDLGSARGFVKEQVLTDTNKTKAKQAVMGAAEAAGHYAAANIKKSVLDGKFEATNVQLSAPPKAKLSGAQRSFHYGNADKTLNEFTKIWLG